MKLLIRDLLPPLIWKMGQRLCGVVRRYFNQSRQFKFGVEQPTEFYDQSFNGAEHWRAHYSRSHYYPLWTVVADRIHRLNPQHILDIGCGPGQVACLLRDSGVVGYLGIDFSKARVARAREICPEYQFIAASIFEIDILETSLYDCVLFMEFLEHVERDIDVLRRVRTGATVIATVPNLPGIAHVRHFKDAGSVLQRYERLLDQIEVHPILANERGKRFFILQGIRKTKD